MARGILVSLGRGGRQTFNWLDYSTQGIKYATRRILNPDLSNGSQFRAEVNQAMLQICLIPDSFIESFVKTYVRFNEEQFSTLIKARREQLKISALQNDSFKQYLKSSEASFNADCILSQMILFRANGIQVIPIENQTRLENDFKEMLMLLFEHELELKFKLRSDLLKLIYKIESFSNVKDTLLSDFIKSKNEAVETTNAATLIELKNELEAVLGSIASVEVLDIRATITRFRQSAGLFTTGMKQKANNIESALYKTPLLERKNLLSSHEVNEVQKALASHRYGSTSSLINKLDQIDLEKSTKTWKEFKNKYQRDEPVTSDVKTKFKPKSHY